MTAKAKFEVYNNNHNLVVNENYKNLFLSRKIAGNTLPAENMSWDNGCFVKGEYLARRIDLLPEKDEIFAAVAAPIGQVCQFFIYNSIIRNTNKAYLCAAQRTYPSDRCSAYQWDSSSTVATGMTDTRYVPDGIDVFVFAKSKKGKQASTNAGLQIFDASGNCVYDSRFLNARIGGASGYYSPLFSKRVAICGGGGIFTIGTETGGGYQSIIYGYGIRYREDQIHHQLYASPQSAMSQTGIFYDQNPIAYSFDNAGWIMFDVTNF